MYVNTGVGIAAPVLCAGVGLSKSNKCYVSVWQNLALLRYENRNVTRKSTIESSSYVKNKLLCGLLRFFAKWYGGQKGEARRQVQSVV
jgi:hypothetical protein